MAPRFARRYSLVEDDEVALAVRVAHSSHLVFWLGSFAIIERQEPLGRCVRDDARCIGRAYRREVLPDFPCSHGAAQKLHVFTRVNPYRDLQRWVSTSYSCLSIALER